MSTVVSTESLCVFFNFKSCCLSVILGLFSQDGHRSIIFKSIDRKLLKQNLNVNFASALPRPMQNLPGNLDCTSSSALHLQEGLSSGPRARCKNDSLHWVSSAQQQQTKCLKFKSLSTHSPPQSTTNKRHDGKSRGLQPVRRWTCESRFCKAAFTAFKVRAEVQQRRGRRRPGSVCQHSGVY